MTQHSTDQSANEIPYGYCHCGCGQQTPSAPQTHTAKGWIKGQPLRYLPGHNIAPYRHTLAEAFWLYCVPGAPDTCWLWQGPLHKGYGFFERHGKRYYAHRVSYELHYGPIPATEKCHDTSVCHTCDMPACCNPAHLFLGTQADNNRDMTAKGRHADLRGEQNGYAKLTEKDVIEIRCLHEQGIMGTAIGRQFNVSKSLIYQIVRREAWKHVP